MLAIHTFHSKHRKMHDCVKIRQSESEGITLRQPPTQFRTIVTVLPPDLANRYRRILRYGVEHTCLQQGRLILSLASCAQTSQTSVARQACPCTLLL